MANLTVTIPDPVVPRIQLAFGRRDINGVWVPATLAEVRDEIKAFLRSRVGDYEVNIIADAARLTISQEVWNGS